MAFVKEIFETEIALALLWLIMTKSRIREYSKCMRQNRA